MFDSSLYDTGRFSGVTVGPRTYTKKLPHWGYDNRLARKLILHAFPKCETDEDQRKSAEQWNRIIYLYWRAGFTYSQIAEELYQIPSTLRHIHVGEARIRGILRSIRRVARRIGLDLTEKRKVRLKKPAGVTKVKIGRPRLYDSNAARQKAYRDRMRSGANST